MAKYIGRIMTGILLIIVMLPFYIMIIGSLKPNFALFEIPPDIAPVRLISDNFNYVFKQPIARWMVNSFIISAAIALGTVFIDAAAGYVFAKKEFPGKKQLFGIVVATMVLPIQVFIVPMFIVVNKIGLYNSLAGVVLPAIAAPFGVFLLKQYMQTLPDDIILAAKIDGAHELKIFSHIIFPLSLPAVGVLAVFNFISGWNDYLWQLIVLTDSEKWTMPLALAGMVSKYYRNVGYQLAGSVLATLPIVIVFLLMQKSLIRGITLGAVKG